MPVCSGAQSLVLPAGQIQSFIPAHAQRLQVLRGCVWLTISGVPDDYWLMDGDEIRLPSGGRIVLEAYKADCEFRLTGLPQECTASTGAKGHPLHGKFRASSH